MPRTSNLMLNRRRDNGRSCLVPDLGEKQSFTIKCDLGCSFFKKKIYRCLLSDCKSSFLFLVCWDFYPKWMLNYVRCFFLIESWIFSFKIFIWWIIFSDFSNTEPFHSWVKYYLVVLLLFFIFVPEFDLVIFCWEFFCIYSYRGY